MVGLVKEISNIVLIQNFDKRMESIDDGQIEAIGKIQWIIRRP